jgi:hypothetical protein
MKWPTQLGLVDRAARDRAIEALERLDPADENSYCDIAPPDFASDAALGALVGLDPLIWVLAPQEEKAELKARWVLFLRTDLPYEKPTHVWSWPFQDRRQMRDAAQAAGIVDDEKHPLYHTHRLREAAAVLLDRYLSGEIGGNEVLGHWPETELDQALFRFGKYDEILLRGDRKDGTKRPAHTAPGASPLERFRLFLKTDLPYTWDSLAKENIAVVVLAGLLVFFGGPAVIALGYHFFPGWGVAAWVAVFVAIAWILFGGIVCVQASFWLLHRRMRRSLGRGRLRHWPFQSAEELDRAANEGHEQEPAHAPFN